MSNAIVPMSTVVVDDPRTKLENQTPFVVLEGGQQVSWQPITATSLSTNNINFETITPSPSTIIDRRMYIRMTVTLTFVGTGPGVAPLLQASYDAPRAFPLASVTDNLTITINNAATSINMRDVLYGLIRYNTSHDNIKYDYGLTPSMLDNTQEYGAVAGTVNNPLSTYGDNSYNVARGAFPITVISNTNTEAVIQFTICEPIFISPFIFGSSEQPGFIGVQNLRLTWSLGNPARMWSHADVVGSSGTITSINAVYSSCSLLLNYITPKEVSRIPEAISYSYYNVTRYITSAQSAIVPAASSTISSLNIQLKSIPRRIYIYARRPESNTPWSQSDTFLSLTGVSVNWNNRSGLLGSATQQDLYNISRKNGCNLSWSEWSGGPTVGLGQSAAFTYGLTGSVLCLTMGVDIGLESTECPGINGTWQLQVNATFQNRAATNITPDMYILIVEEGTWTILNQRSVSEIGVLSKMDALNATQVIRLDDVVLASYGGNFWSGFKDIASKVYRGAKKVGSEVIKGTKEVLPIARDIARLGKDLAPLALLAAGDNYNPHSQAQNFLGGAKKKKKRGGKMLTDAQIRRRLLK